jgi:membrane associated rhomboid family serine protease
MFPIGDDNRFRRSTPVVTYALIALNIAFFLVELNQGEAFVEKWAFIPRQFLANPGGEFLTLFTSMFMHAGWLHLGSNMLYLWIFGDNVEDRFGRGRFLAFYLLCGLGAIATQLLFTANSSIPNLGASGAIAGVLGAYLILFPQGRVHVLQGQRVIPVPALMVIGLWFVLQLFSGIGAVVSASTNSGGVAYMAHIGGFLAGILLTMLLTGRRRLPLAV